VQAASLPALHIFRPSFLIGHRKERRLGEAIAVALAQLLKPTLVGPLARYAPITASALAKEMIRQAQKGLQGLQIFEGEKLKR
jgi:hypothetical protein